MDRGEREVKATLGTRHLVAFFLGSFGITWGIGAVYLAMPGAFDAWLGASEVELHPLFRIAVYGPALAAFAVVAVARGRWGLRAYARRLLHWHVHPGWYAAVLLGAPASQLVARWIALAFGAELEPWPREGWPALLAGALVGLAADPGPVEELGWRGFALPLLQRRMAALPASLILGFVWGIWHLPAFFVAGAPQAAYGIPAFVVGSMVISVLMTVVYNGSGGSLPLAFLFHWANNSFSSIRSGPVGAIWIALCALAAVALMVRFGTSRLGPRKETHVFAAKRGTVRGAASGDEPPGGVPGAAANG